MRAGLFPAWRATFPCVQCQYSGNKYSANYSGAAWPVLTVTTYTGTWRVMGTGRKIQNATPVKEMKTINHAGTSPARVEVLEIVLVFFRILKVSLGSRTHARTVRILGIVGTPEVFSP